MTVTKTIGRLGSALAPLAGPVRAEPGRGPPNGRLFGEFQAKNLASGSGSNDLQEAQELVGK